MKKQHLLIIDDETDVNRILKMRLQKHGYQISSAKTAKEGLKAVFAKVPDLILLDLMLPDRDGLDVCKELRADKRSKAIPIIMLTAKDTTADEVIGLEIGADDYVTKPFDFAVLHSRVKKLLMRDQTKSKKTDGSESLKAGKLVLDPVRQKSFVDGQEIELTTLEFRIVEYFMRHPGRVFSRDELMSGAWKDHVTIVDRAVDVHINGIRKKLDKASHYIETVRGAGYRFKEF